MPKNQRLIKFTTIGLLEFMILKMVKIKSFSAQEMSDRLKEAHINAPLGTIYPILKKVRAKGLVRSGLEEFDNGTIQKTCNLNDAGRRHLTEMEREWKHLNRFIAEL